jgi:hypothetical protein
LCITALNLKLEIEDIPVQESGNISVEDIP